MLPRILEPEVMDTEAEAVDYDSMDHREVNRLFVGDFLNAWNSTGDLDENVERKVLDAGTGTAQVPIELCRRSRGCRVTAGDLAGEMLKVATRNVQAAGLENAIRLQRIDAKQMPYADGSFDAVISNSIVHHIPDPRGVLAELLRVLRPGGLLFVRDLLRPAEAETLHGLVETYAAGANRHQRQMFRESLHAALTLAEVRQILIELGIPSQWVTQTTDRHWTILGFL